MTNYKIYLDKTGLRAVNVPQEPVVTLSDVDNQFAFKEYQHQLDEAVNADLFFKDEIRVFDLMCLEGCIGIMDRFYSVPKGFQVKINDDECYTNCVCDETNGGKCMHTYAELVSKDIDPPHPHHAAPTIATYKLVPKQKDIEPEFRASIEKNFDRLIDGKQQSIEEDAAQSWNLNHIGPDNKGYNPFAYRAGYIAGAKSQAAKEKETCIAFAFWLDKNKHSVWSYEQLYNQFKYDQEHKQEK